MKTITKTVPEYRFMLALNNIYGKRNFKNIVSIEYKSSVCPGCSDVKYQVYGEGE